MKRTLIIALLTILLLIFPSQACSYKPAYFGKEDVFAAEEKKEKKEKPKPKKDFFKPKKIIKPNNITTFWCEKDLTNKNV